MVKIKSNIIEAKAEIAQAATDATKIIAQAASEAAKVVAAATAEAVKVKETRDSGDHDLLIELKTKMDDLKNDIAELKDGTSTKIASHEIRIVTLENTDTRVTVMLSIGVGILTLLISLLIWHLVGKG